MHCSAGIGRTALVVVIDMILDKINKHGVHVKINVLYVVNVARTYRRRMVLTAKQYRYIYETLEYRVAEIQAM